MAIGIPPLRQAQGSGFQKKLRSGFQTKVSYTLNELMVVAAAREIKEGEVVFVGMRQPLITFVRAAYTQQLGRDRVADLGENCQNCQNRCNRQD